MLLALGLSAVILSAIYSLLFVGARNWRRVRQRAEIFQTGRIVLERLESDLQNALVLSKGQLHNQFPFKGEASSLSFPAMMSMIDPQAAQAPYEQPVVGVVTYAWNQSASGQASSLERDWTLLIPDESPSYETTGKDVFPPLISSVTFSYAYRNAPGGYPAVVWSGQWHQPERIPGAVRVSLVLTHPDSGEQVTLSKTIPIFHGLLGDAAWVADVKP